MRSVRFSGNSRVEIIDVEKPTLKPGEVLVQISLSAICGSDLKAYHAQKAAAMPVGHEMIGRIVEITPGCMLEKGRRVSIYVLKGCGQCSWCLTDNMPFCPKLEIIVGGHNDYIAVPEQNCIPIPDDIPDEAAVIMAADALGVSFHLNSRINVKKDETVVVVGVGPVGLGAVTLCAFLGAKVIAVDLNAYRLAFAQELGAVQAINLLLDDSLKKIMDLTDGAGANVVFECAGQSTSLGYALDAAGPAGRIGVCGENSIASIKPSDQLIRKELAVYGSWYFRMADPAALYQLYRNGLCVEKMITHRFPIDEVDKAYAQFASGNSGKVVLVSS